MKVILVNGSPNKQGCTHQALQIVADALQSDGVEAQIFWIGNKPISGCLGCNRCADRGQCIFDDSVNQFTALAAEADAFVFGSPVHYASAAGNMTSFLDRVFYSDANTRQTLYHKPAAIVASARRAGTTATLDQLAKYPAICNMPIVTSCYWTMVHGRSPEEVMQDAEGVQIMQTLGHNMAWIVKSIAAGRNSGVTQPKKIDRIFTNFIR